MAYKDPKFSLYRSKDGAILGGVCSGLSESLKIDVTIIRILFLIPLFSIWHRCIGLHCLLDSIS